VSLQRGSAIVVEGADVLITIFLRSPRFLPAGMAYDVFSHKEIPMIFAEVIDLTDKSELFSHAFTLYSPKSSCPWIFERVTDILLFRRSTIVLPAANG
jgi:hypothetical protein